MLYEKCGSGVLAIIFLKVPEVFAKIDSVQVPSRLKIGVKENMLRLSGDSGDC